MGGTTARAGQTGPRTRVVRAALAGALLLTPLACGSAGAPSAAPSTPGPDPAAVRPYCDTVSRVQAEQTGPGAGKGGVTAASATTRRQLADLVRTAPPEIAGDWRTVQRLTEQALGSLAATRGDAKRIDRALLDRLQRESTPAQDRIKIVTEKRCGIVFRPPS